MAKFIYTESMPPSLVDSLEKWASDNNVHISIECRSLTDLKPARPLKRPAAKQAEKQNKIYS